jgi:hypothetical protein
VGSTPDSPLDAPSPILCFFLPPDENHDDIFFGGFSGKDNDAPATDPDISAASADVEDVAVDGRSPVYVDGLLSACNSSSIKTP